MRDHSHRQWLLACALMLAGAALWALPTPSQAQDARVLSGPGQAWSDWVIGGSAHAADPSEAERQRERQQRAEAQREAVRRGMAAPLTTVDGWSGAVAKGLGLATDAVTSEEANRQLAAISAELERRGMFRAQRAVDAARAALRRAGLLDPDDADAEPKVPDGNPGVPSACEGNPACGQCYERAIDDLDNTRLRLEKLRAIYRATYRYGKNMMSYADGVSAIHGVAALAWQSRKVDVIKSLKNLDRAYDAKYEELIRQLHTDLQGYSRCESEVMHVPDWFDRFGFVYYQFMKDHYRRPDL